MQQSPKDTIIIEIKINRSLQDNPESQLRNAMLTSMHSKNMALILLEHSDIKTIPKDFCIQSTNQELSWTMNTFNSDVFRMLFTSKC